MPTHSLNERLTVWVVYNLRGPKRAMIRDRNVTDFS
jgi:hypothetical protein